MKKFSLTEALPRLAVAATIVTMLVVVLINVFPPLEEAVIIDDQSSITQSSSVSIKEGNINSSNSSGRSDSSSVPDKSLSSSNAPQSIKININTASVSELMILDGIGEVKAKAIVEYRTKNGNFKSIDELVLVSGIGEKTLEKNRDRITV